MKLKKSTFFLSLSLLNGYVNPSLFAQTTIVCSNSKIHCVGLKKEFSNIQFALDNSQKGDTIAVFSGIYPEALLIEQNNITLKSANRKQRVILTGEKSVENWKVFKKFKNGMQLYKAPSPAKSIERLFIRNRELPASRYPQKGFIEISKVFKRDSTNKSKQNFSIPLQKKYKNHFLENSHVHIRINPWTIYSSQVQQTNKQARLSVKLKNSLPMDIKFQNKLFFTQVVENIHHEGEWAWSKDANYPNGSIYLMAKKKPIHINTSIRKFGIKIGKNARNIKIEGLQITKIQGDAISFNTSSPKRRVCSSKDNYQIINNHISYTTGWGINLFNGCEKGKTTVKNNELHHCRTGALKFRNVGRLIVEKNNIHDIATSSYNDDMLTHGEYNAGTGILVQSCQAARVLHNRIENTGYNGIAVINYDAPVSSRLVAYNHIKNAMQGLNDGAGIYVHTKRTKAILGEDTIRNNIVENCQGSFMATRKHDGYYPQGVGIYLDDYSTNVNVFNNTIIGSAINLFLHEAKKINVKKNILFNATQKTLYITNRRKTCATHPLDNQINNNILIPGIQKNKKPLQDIYSLRNYLENCSILKSSNNNIIITRQKPFQEYIDNNKKRHISSLEAWKQEKILDIHSQVIKKNQSDINLLTNSSSLTQNYLNAKDCRDIKGKAIKNIQLNSFQTVVLVNCSKLPKRN